MLVVLIFFVAFTNKQIINLKVDNFEKITYYIKTKINIKHSTTWLFFLYQYEFYNAFGILKTI